jgi:hypothetical protein
LSRISAERLSHSVSFGEQYCRSPIAIVGIFRKEQTLKVCDSDPYSLYILVWLFPGDKVVPFQGIPRRAVDESIEQVQQTFEIVWAALSYVQM